MADIINIRSWFHGRADAHQAVINALERPFPTPRTMKDIGETASWLLEGLWLEGYKVTPIGPGNDDGAA